MFHQTYLLLSKRPKAEPPSLVR